MYKTFDYFPWNNMKNICTPQLWELFLWARKLLYKSKSPSVCIPAIRHLLFSFSFWNYLNRLSVSKATQKTYNYLNVTIFEHPLDFHNLIEIVYESENNDNIIDTFLVRLGLWPLRAIKKDILINIYNMLTNLR